ncbi:MotA/TolQ/ExbB proton channel family protein [Pseudofulvimonas gallinarii]|uniref:Biopolymer transport protein ExbB n=1 Tax=Pseudofulvimonas gallinarii TaxID=634155 RepID=A0A4R3L1G2_9GAMM|nr:MotA/TolQ/ExbB proton channel family protein [Pseudofulvimonas gallinarii]TCS92328.1 biopolymer transport protein ExbB [Pseudofulvimonas gallinarii]THD11249.1 biopolymer transporter ExbB [Pseudofulvimonas gallinarii]
MLELFKAGGWVMWPIALISVIASGIVLERFWSLRRRTVLPPGLGEEVREWARHTHLDPKHIDAQRNTSPLGQVLAAGLDVRRRPREIIRERIEDTGRHAMHQLERYLNTLGTIASTAPLLGLLGTVIGMMRMFLGILDHGIGDMTQLAGGIGQALVTTAAGICVAIPALVFHRYFRGLVAAYVIEMERQAMALIDTLDSVAQPAPPAAPVRRRGTAA